MLALSRCDKSRKLLCSFVKAGQVDLDLMLMSVGCQYYLIYIVDIIFIRQS